MNPAQPMFQQPELPGSVTDNPQIGRDATDEHRPAQGPFGGGFDVGVLFDAQLFEVGQPLLKVFEIQAIN